MAAKHDRLTTDALAAMARITLGHVAREYPNKLDHVLQAPTDAVTPRMLHPVFFGSFDWHSCVHGWWQLLTIARLAPGLAEAREIRALADMSLVPDKIAGEMAYLDRPGAAAFERPYGWAWALMLHAEAARHEAVWADALAPLAARLAEALGTYIYRLDRPIRAGTHANTAFALVFARRWAEQFDGRLAQSIADRAAAWFGADQDYPATWEPDGKDFLSPALCEGLLMAELLPEASFRSWFAGFLPALVRGKPSGVLTPIQGVERADPRVVHLDGLNLSRAWCLRRIGDRLEPKFREILHSAAEDHLSAALPFLSGDYAGEHWLASFALLALGGDR